MAPTDGQVMIRKRVSSPHTLARAIFVELVALSFYAGDDKSEPGLCDPEKLAHLALDAEGAFDRIVELGSAGND